MRRKLQIYTSPLMWVSQKAEYLRDFVERSLVVNCRAITTVSLSKCFWTNLYIEPFPYFSQQPFAFFTINTVECYFLRYLTQMEIAPVLQPYRLHQHFVFPLQVIDVLIGTDDHGRRAPKYLIHFNGWNRRYHELLFLPSKPCHTHCGFHCKVIFIHY